MGNQVIPQLAAALCWLSLWALLYALRLVGRSERSLTRRLLQYAQRHPWRTIASLLVLLQVAAVGGGKGPPEPPITGAVTSIWHRVELVLRRPDTGELVPIPGSYKEIRTITEIRDPEEEEGGETP